MQFYSNGATIPFTYVYFPIWNIILLLFSNYHDLLVQEQIDKEDKTDLDDGYVYDVYYRDDAMDLDDQINFNNIASLYVKFLN